MLKSKIQSADAVLIGAGAGISAASGFSYSGERFEQYFPDFHDKYGITDMYSGGFYPYETMEEYWAWWSRHVLINRYDNTVGKPYSDLLKMMNGKNYFVLTTNVDHQFQKSGFDKKRLFYTQGDYGLFQCSHCPTGKTFDNEDEIRAMAAQQKNMKIPSDLIPRCPVCGEALSMNLRCDNNFVQDDGWYSAYARYKDFIIKNQNSRILYLEIGVGLNTPGIIKYPFWEMTAKNPNSYYFNINAADTYCPENIASRSVLIGRDIGNVLAEAAL